jgi:hypothetical protein
MTTEALRALDRALELDDIQNGVLHPRPLPYVATYIVLRIDDRRAGREMLRRLIPDIASAADPTSPDSDAWLSIALTYRGLEAFGAPQASLDSFAPEFQEGMAARAALLGDVGESSPALWEKPLGTPDVHVLLTAISPDTSRRDDLGAPARRPRIWRGSRRSIARTPTCCPPGGKPSGSRMASAIRPSRGAALPAPTPRSAP